MNDDDDLRVEVRQLQSEIDSLSHRVSTLESALEDDLSLREQITDKSDPERTGFQEQTATEPGAGTLPPSEQQSSEYESHSGSEAPASRPTEDTGNLDWERDIGIKWLGRVGGITLVFGVVFFIQVAIESGILGLLGRVVAGVLGGTALLAGGRFAACRPGYRRWGRIISGTGLVITFFSIYAAYGFRSYRTAIGTQLWVVLLGLTTLVAGTAIVSVYDRHSIVASEAFLLGYVTAYLSLDTGNFIVTPVYALLLSLGLVVIATVRPWSRHIAVSIPLTYGLVVMWVIDLDPAWGIAAGTIVTTFAIYTAGSVVLRQSDRADVWHEGMLRLLTALNAVSAAALLEWIIPKWFPKLPVEGIGAGIIALALVGIFLTTSDGSISQDNTAGTGAVLLFGISVLLAAETFVATVGLLTTICAAVMAARYADIPATRTGAHLVTLVTVAKLLAVDSRELAVLDFTDPVAAATGRLAAFSLAVLVFYGLAWLFRDNVFTLPLLDGDTKQAVPYILIATALTIIGIGLELSGFSLSAAWAIFGAVLLGSGLRVDMRLFRLQAIIVFGLTTAKVFLLDTQGINLLARTFSFLVLGAILLAASYAYARWRGDRPFNWN